MINLTHLDGSGFVLNAERIESVEAHPDTVITTIDGKHFVVQQSVTEVVTRAIRYQQSVHHGTSDWRAGSEREGGNG